MGWQFRSKWKDKFVPVERCFASSGSFQWNSECSKTRNKLQLLPLQPFHWKLFRLPVEAKMVAMFIKMPTPIFNKHTPQISKGTHYVPVVVLGRELCTNSSCSRNGRDTKAQVFIKHRGAPHFLILVYKDTVLR